MKRQGLGKGMLLKDAYNGVSSHQSAFDIRLEESGKSSDIADVVLIDSSKRNRSAYPNPNKYTVELPLGLSLVTEISLTYAYIPMSEYTIQRHNNMFYFSDMADQLEGTMQQYKIALPHGNYPIEDGYNSSIIQELQDRMNAVSKGSNYTVSVNKYTNKVTIEQQPHGSGIFSISLADSTGENYLSNSVGPVLGFQPTSLSGKISYTGQQVYNLTPVPYILMRLTCDGHKLTRMKSNNPHANDCFCPIYLNTVNNHFVYNQDVNIDTYRYTVAPMLPSLNKIDVEFLHGDGTPYDFNGLDHVLNFEVSTR